MRLTYIGATLGATIGATIGAGKHLAKWLIISGRCKRCHQTSVLHVYVRERECFAHKCTKGFRCAFLRERP